MLTPKETNELIRELKKNRTDMLPRCKLKIANRYDNLREALGGNDVDCLNPAGYHWDSGGAGSYAGVIYSLPLDYPEVPEVTEGWVEVAVDNKGFLEGPLGIARRWHVAPTEIPSAYSQCISHFGGYIFLSLASGEPKLSSILVGYNKSNALTTICTCWDKPATPIALRFWSTDVAKACTLGFKPWKADER